HTRTALLAGRALSRASPSFPTRRSSDLLEYVSRVVVNHEPILQHRAEAPAPLKVGEHALPAGRVGEDNQSVQPDYSRARQRGHRSEEHTSELQSPDHLVCRLMRERDTSP